MRRIVVTHVQVTETTDDYGNTVTVETPVDVPRCLLAPRSSTERTDPHSPAVISGSQLYMPARSTPPAPADYFLIDGKRYDAEGEPGVWPGRGIEVAVKHIP
ncbi:hypothetical protein ncot_13285 [Nocardioides sp. JQ2195]|uniref:hypothetical protein n=1 Tax=Nocardioides sp. JQ2195 TaxID=2592334 RepID=UPI00143E98D5|nr:hypothetical protein [Nocardioides sp. JQ2195]QIX27472.1 hypothetical protein ncot_13285 [Nocardioides sp. JQ2195]